MHVASLSFVRNINHKCKPFKSVHILFGSEKREESSTKLPILQLYEDRELVAEFICGVDYDASLSKIKAFLSQYRNYEALDAMSYTSCPVDNVYSENLLEDYLRVQKLVVLKIYRNQCKFCQIFDPVFCDLAKDPLFNHIRWLQLDVDALPKFKSELTKRLSGKTAEESDLTSDCITCGNSGFVVCSSCKSLGFIQKSDVAIICPNCLGHLKFPSLTQDECMLLITSITFRFEKSEMFGLSERRLRKLQSLNLF
jgi:hypothetical protein